jgi:MerR family transcriptional regulator, heat shock protein HspR
VTIDWKTVNSDPVYTIGVAAKMVGVSVQLLRVYEKEGLILSSRTETGRRMYSDLEIEKILCIRRMLALLPCWKLRQCNDHDKNSCHAFHAYERPCWATEEKCAHPLDSCRDCIVYKSTINCDDIKKILFD